MARPINCSSSSVKLYLCSNPDDSVVERKALREGVFPKFREHCRHALGLDVRVIDPFESSDSCKWPDANTRKQLIQECRESSAGPFLLALVGHEYGRISLPDQLEVSQYQLLLRESQRAGVGTVDLERVYRRDENTIPPSYCLKSQAEIEQLDGTTAECIKVFLTAVSLCVFNGQMTPDEAQAYCRSALDVDLRFSLEESAYYNVSGRCLVYTHKVNSGNGKKELKSHQLSKSEDTVMSDLITHEALLSCLCDKFLLSLATTCNLQVYTTTTECPNGYTATRRRCYADSLCQQVYSDLVKMTECLDISHCCKEPLFTNAFAREQAEQEEVCNVLSKFYEVIRPEKDEIRNYVQNEQWHPLVVTGGPCTGKTVLLAHCSQEIKLWLQGSDPVVIAYLCGLSVNSSSKHTLLSLCYQIAKSYQSYFSTKQDPNLVSAANSEWSSCCKDINSTCNVNFFDDRFYITEADMSIYDLKQHMSRLISLLPSPKHPLVLLLDGLDQMDYNYGLQVIESLPSPLPASVKLLLTVSSNRKHIVQALELHYPQCNVSAVDEKSGFFSLQLELPTRKDCVKMLASQLANSGRRITSGQQALVNQAVTSCSLPLYARLLHKHASLWHSDSEVTESTLTDRVHSSISKLLDYLEHKHGLLLVSHTLSYLTLSRTGLTEAELTDLLSNDNKVLAQYFTHHDVSLPKMRIPQVDVDMLLLDLRPFISRRTVAGTHVLIWISRHFELVITKRYLSTPTKKSEFHSEMADFFSGRWSCGCAKPLELVQNNTESKIYIDRQPSSQPYFFTSSSNEDIHVNMRKILELPYHLKESSQTEELHKLVLSLDFQQAMLKTGLLTDLVAMLDWEEESFKECSLLANILKSSACFLNDFSSELPSVMELTLLPYKGVLPELESYINEIKQVRKKRGIGVALYPAYSTVPPFNFIKSQAVNSKLTEAAVTQCGVVIEIMDDSSVWIWKANGNEFVKLSLSIEEEKVKFARVKSSGQFIFLSSLNNKHFLWNVSRTDYFQEIKDSSGKTPKTVENFVACPEKICIQWRDESFVSVFKISNGTMMHFHCQKPVTCLACSSDCSTMYCGQDEGTFSIFDTNTTSLLGTCSNSNHETVISVIVCEDRQQTACIDKTGSITLWDIATKAPSLLKEMSSKAKSDDILNIDSSMEIHSLLVCHSHQITLWNTCEWKETDQFLAPKGRTFIKALLSQDSHLFLALLSQSSSVLVWRLSTGQCVLSLNTPQLPYTFFKMASDTISVSNDGSLAIWNSEMVYAAGIAPKMACGVKEVLVEQDGNGFFLSDGSKTVWKWSLETDQPNASLIHYGPVEKIKLSLDSIHLVTLSSNDIYIWNTGSGQNTLRINGSGASDILITPNNNFGVSLSEDGLSHVWKLVNGAVVCTIPLPLLDAQISPESTFLIGLHHGELLAASLWSGAINKKFTCDESPEKVVAFQTLSKHPDFVIVLLTSGSLYTWNVAEETVFRHFKIPNMLHCQPQMSCNGSYAVLSTDDETLTLLDLSQFRLCSFKTSGIILKACLDTSGGYAICCSSQANRCECYLHSRLVLSVVRLEDGKTVASLYLPKNPTTLAMHKQQFVVVGFEDGAVGVYYFNTDGEQPISRKEKSDVNQCPLDQALCTWLPLTAPNILWS